MQFQELDRLYKQPLFALLSQARAVHEAHWSEDSVQLCTLLSIKTGGCSEDCSYCSQSARYNSDVEAERLMEKQAVLDRALTAKESGSTRFCMGAAWKGVRGGTKRFDDVLDIVRAVSTLGMEVCVTLGELGPDEAVALRDAGVTAYNHNLDTSPEHYPNIVTTHTYEDRLNTIRNVQDAGMSVCCGGILGLGETVEDRLRMLEVISEFNPAPESVPINSLMPMPGTPLEGQDPVTPLEVVRMIALARIALPKSRVRLSAGRSQMSEEAQTLAFFAGANSIFYGEKLLTGTNPAIERDMDLLDTLGLQATKADPSLQSPTPDTDRPRYPVPAAHS